MIKAAFFDLDGTLVDSVGGLMTSMNLVMEKLGFPKITPAQTKKYVGNGYQVFVEKSLKAASDKLYAKAEKAERKNPDLAMELEMQADDALGAYEEACEEYLKVFAVHFLDNSDAYPGMRESLAELRNQGIKLVCVTNKPVVATDKTLDKAFGPKYFDYVVCDDGIIPKKPDPTGCRKAMEAMGVTEDEVLYFGDTKTDMVTAKNAGFRSVGCLYGFRDRKELEESGADYLIAEPLELLEIVAKLNGPA